MDFSRRAYKTACRFFTDDDRESVVRWMDARPGALCIPFESCILEKQMEPDAWLPGGIGEVAEAERITTLEKSPPGTGRGHVCGTEEMFRDGERYDPDSEPVRYGTGGLPLCCFPPLGAVVGGGGGLAADFLIVPPPPPEQCPAATTTCAAAPPGERSHECSYAHVPGFTPDTVWRKWTTTVGEAARFIVTTNFRPASTLRLWAGNSCGGLTLVWTSPYVHTFGVTVDFTAPGTGVWLEMASDPADTTTVTHMGLFSQ